jgi:flavorubredoxin
MPAPIEIATGTYAVPLAFPVPGFGQLNVTPLVIRGAEPVLVDTGPPIFRDDYLASVFSLLDPDDVRWIFLSHDDRDHSGNLMAMLERCPNARLLTTFVGVGRMGEEWQLPLDRVVLLNDGETLDLPDRQLTAISPPFFDAPGTRGLWDSSTGHYYAVDCFGALTPGPCVEVGDVAEDAYRAGFDMFNRLNHPWHVYTDASKVAAGVDRIRALQPRLITSYHGPAATGRIDELCDMLAASAAGDPLPLPTQQDLQAMLASAAAS